MNTQILVVEDDPALAELLRYNFECEGFGVAVVSDGDAALDSVRGAPPDLVVLDWMLPGTSGIEICRQIRRTPEIRALPVVMLTARGEETDRVNGLDGGADDYLVKPFSIKELMARVRAVLRRTRPGQDAEVLDYGGIVMDLTTHKVSRDTKPIHLGPTEFRLLKVLLERPGRVFSREQLLDRAWGRDIHVELRTVDVHIRRLRKALNDGGAKDLIRTVRSAGYAVEAPSP